MTADPFEFYFSRGLTDGLPVVPPTAARVKRLLKGTGRGSSEVVALVPPNYAKATVEKIAINAVMAGCRPEYLPVVIAGVEAMCDERFNLHGVQATTHFATPLFIVNGPIRKRLGVNCADNVFGQGWRANATMGRALRLIMVNIGGARPGEISKSTMGHPGKYTYLIGEHEEVSPWPPFHEERGLRREQSAISVFAGEAPHGISDHASRTAPTLVASLGHSMACIWNHKHYLLGETLLVICPEHAAIIARDGWTKAQVRQEIFSRVRRPVRELVPGEDGGEGLPKGVLDSYGVPSRSEVLIPKFAAPECLLIVVAGGLAGGFSACLPGWAARAGSQVVTRPIEE